AITIKTNVVIGLIVVMLATLAIPGVPVTNVAILIGICMVYTGINCAFLYAARRDVSENTTRIVAKALIPWEVVLNTLGIYFTGGVLTPMFIIYMMNILMSIVLLNPKGVYKIAALIISQYVLLMALEAFQIVPRLEVSWSGHKLYAEQNFENYVAYVLIVGSTMVATGYMGNMIARVIRQRDEKINSQVGDLRSIYDISRTLGNLTTEREIVKYLASTLALINDATMCVVTTVSKDGSLNIAATEGLTPGQVAALRAGDYQHLAIVREKLAKGLPAILDDLSQDRPVKESIVPGKVVESLYIFPVMAEEKVLGTISLGFEERNSLSGDYCELLRTVANQAGMAIQRTRLFSDLQKLAKEMSALYEVGLHTGSTLSQDEVIKRTAANMEKMLAPDMYYIALFEEETCMMSFEFFKQHGQILPKMKAILGPDISSLTGSIITLREPLLVRDWKDDEENLNRIAQKTGPDMRSYLGVPMLFDNRVIGVLSVQCVEPRMFDDDSLRLLEAMATQTAAAIENCRLHQEAQIGAEMDSLTKVYNHGRFVEMVEEAILESDKNGTQVSLIMLDIDHFKQYNDTYGHVTGDKVLRIVADTLRRSVREEDSVGRWGGEEFGVLLPGVDAAEAKIVARRIRREVAELRPLDTQGNKIKCPTLSQGISVYPFPSHSTSQLIEEADAALYFAKEHGRNQLVVSDISGNHNARLETTVANLAGFIRADTTTDQLSSKLDRYDVSLVTQNLA
ncbi:MAG: sensor domain-containing diguanylate cyclase, partial [Chloroflexia bacterium]